MALLRCCDQDKTSGEDLIFGCEVGTKSKHHQQGALRQSEKPAPECRSDINAAQGASRATGKSQVSAIEAGLEVAQETRQFPALAIVTRTMRRSALETGGHKIECVAPGEDDKRNPST